MYSQTAAKKIQDAVVPSTVGIAADDSSALKSIGSVCQFSRNHTIFSDGDPASHSYKVVSGAVRLVKLMPDGRRHIGGFLLRGDLFGIEWTKDYALSAEAVSDVTAIRYSKSNLERLSEERTEVRRQITDRLRNDLYAAQAHLILLSCQSARERVASFLLLLARRLGSRDGGAIELAMGRQDIADYLGLTIETVCRTLSDLKAQGLIEIPDRHQVVIRSHRRLETIAEGGADA